MNGGRKAVFTIVAMAVTVGWLWYNYRPVTPKKATWEDVVAEAKRGGYRLIGTEELWENYRKDPQSLLLVDTRREWEYRTGHVKRALNFPMPAVSEFMSQKLASITLHGIERDGVTEGARRATGVSPSPAEKKGQYHEWEQRRKRSKFIHS